MGSPGKLWEDDLFLLSRALPAVEESIAKSSTNLYLKVEMYWDGFMKVINLPFCIAGFHC